MEPDEENAGGVETQVKTRGRPFQPGNKGGPGRGKKKPLAAAGPDLLADFEKAYTTDGHPEDSAMVKALRRMAHNEPMKFAAQYAALKGKAGEGIQRSEDTFGSVGPREVAIEELAERLLAEWEKIGE